MYRIVLLSCQDVNHSGLLVVVVVLFQYLYVAL